jgi:hypothetical protein
MSPESAINSLLAQLCQEAAEAWRAGESTHDYEPAFQRVLEYVLSNPAARPQLDELAVELMNQPDFEALDLISYLMHTLRSPSVLAEARRISTESNDPRVKTALMHVVEAFDDQWEDRAMYRRYAPP